ncbi:large ribosomal subunit protein mL53 [Aulostomus maculatus]
MAAAKNVPVVLKAVKNITIHFCPFESNSLSTRRFLYKVGSEKVRATNLNCEVKVVVKHDTSEPVVDVTYADGEKLLMKGAHLTIEEMMKAFQSRCMAKDLQPKIALQKK